jgi:hypothetical protein
MGFELKDAIEIAHTEIAGYSQWFTSALGSPSYIAQRARGWYDDGGGAGASGGSRDFYAVLLISAVLGATIGAIIPDRPPLKDRFTVAVVVVLAWLLISVCTHFFVRLFRGKAPLGVTVRAMMQVLAMAYVVSNFATLLVTSAAAVFPPLKSLLIAEGFEAPGSVLVGAQFLLLLVYIPATLRAAHGTRGLLAGTAVGVLSALFAAGIAMALVGQQSC